MKAFSFIPFFFLIINLSYGQGNNITAERHEPYKTSEDNIIIENLRISNLGSDYKGNCLWLSGSNNVIIRNCIFENSAGVGVHLSGCTNITIENCSFESNSGGVYAISCTGGIQILNNKFSNPSRPIGTNKRGQHVQFDKVSGSNNKINYNVGECDLGLSNPEDVINLYRSSGEPSSPIEVIGNQLRGGGPSITGGGIMTGDKGGSYILVKDNIVVNPGQYGIAIAAGTNIQLLDNQIYAAPFWVNNVGIYTWNQTTKDVLGKHGNIEIKAQLCENNTILGNKINYNSRRAPNGFNPRSIHYNCNDLTEPFDDNNDLFADIDENILPKNLLSPDLMLHYSFNKNLNDSSGNNLAGTLKDNGISYNTISGENSSANFNGDGHIEVPNDSFESLRPTNEKISISTWINSANSSGIEVSSVEGIAMSSNSDGDKTGWKLTINGTRLTARINIIDQIYDYNKTDGSTPVGEPDESTHHISSNELNPGEWNHIVYTYSKNEIQLYVNGIKSSKTIEPNDKVNYDVSKSNGEKTEYFSRKINYDSNNTPMKIGSSDNTKNFTGQLDDFKIYRGILKEQEIKEDYTRRQK